VAVLLKPIQTGNQTAVTGTQPARRTYFEGGPDVPGEGSIYLWTQKAFGPFWGFFAGFCAWWPGVLVMVATGTVVLSHLGYVFPSTIGSASVQLQGVLIIGFIVLSAVLANQRFRLTQNVVNVVCVLYALAIGLVVVAGIVHVARPR
jgi:amino acid transporter